MQVSNPSLQRPTPRSLDPLWPLLGRAVPVVQPGEQRARSAPSIPEVEQVPVQEGPDGGLMRTIEDPRVRHALSVYQSVQQIQMRDYIRQVFGVDQYA